jgi:hypothetical protein
MTNSNERGQNAALAVSAPNFRQPEANVQQKTAFVSSRREVLSALFSMVLGYLYILVWTDFSWVREGIFFLLFVLGLTGWTLVYTKGERRSRECWLWLGCLWIVALALVARMAEWPVLGRIWQQGWVATLAVHCLGAYWVLVATGRLMGGDSGPFLPLDGWNALVRFPFCHYGLKLRALWWGITHRNRKKCPGRGQRVMLSLTAVAIGLVFLVMAGNLLMAADNGFRALLGGVWDWLDLQRLLHLSWLWRFCYRLILSLPVASYLNGLVAGSCREDGAALRRQGEKLSAALAGLRRISASVWDGLLGVFVAFYLAFFVVQGRYLFGAFFSRLAPGQMTLAQYARQGFFELCMILGLNFALLWVVWVSRQRGEKGRLRGKIMVTLLLAESILFAITAFSKLVLYIGAFGFTALRFQSAWLVLVLTAGCVCTLVSLWTGRKTARVWVLFAGISFALTMLY